MRRCGSLQFVALIKLVPKLLFVERGVRFLEGLGGRLAIGESLRREIIECCHKIAEVATRVHRRPLAGSRERRSESVRALVVALSVAGDSTQLAICPRVVHARNLRDPFGRPHLENLRTRHPDVIGIRVCALISIAIVRGKMWAQQKKNSRCGYDAHG